MTERQLRDTGHIFFLSEDLQNAHFRAKRLTRQLNATLETEIERRQELIQELFASAGTGSYIDPPFRCDYGENITVGENFYANYDCVFLDVGQITIGDNVMLGPKVAIYAAHHPIDPEIRNLHMDYPKPVTIGNSVWIGGNAVVCPGVTIGSNVVIGAGSVVTKDIPDNVIAAGNPCRIIRPITEEDQKYWQRELDEYRRLADEPRA